ncbi:MAG TPA: class I SAM-dependent methyltransferase [Mycobacteriales bacterium]|nr:class I SAM-dependent methyltransferase [Mycobacteriales bacterium]
MPTDRDVAALTSVLADISGVEGWLTPAQARRLWNRAGRVPAGGTIVEIGSFRGRSAIVLARASELNVAVVAIDPHGGGDRGPGEITADAARGEADHTAFHDNIDLAGVSDRIRHIRTFSSQALGDVSDPVDLLYVDGAHRYHPARDDLMAWGAQVRTGGTLLVHDSFNAVGVTLAMLRVLVFGSSYRYVGRDGSLAEYRRVSLRGGARGINIVRQLCQLPYFARMVLVKVALSLRAYPVARALGHSTRDWPF